ncbi:MAG TPA: hypothetical protein VH370_19880 [Humisphaera sp.]|jgi:hypothetical protein|nr:hypothetical protein [Humisphaera sp.]
MLLLLSGFIAAPKAVAADAGPDQYYTLDRLPDPDTNLKLEVGGLNFAADGTLYAGTRRGEVWAWKDGKWKRFASGLAECLGTLPIKPGVVLVTQRAEVTRLIDTDGDGIADRYEKITNDFAYSGNYHEFNFGLVMDKAGNLYGSLNLGHTNHDPWGGQYMGADVKDRGTVYTISPDGKYSTFAWGLRSPNGLEISPDGELFCAESQGEFTATDCLQHLQKDRFYGHPASLSFKPGFTGNPRTTTIAELAKMRTPPIVWFPYKRVGQSVNQPRFDITAGKFGPFAGQIFCGDDIGPILTRVFLEKVGDDYQGACFPFLRKQNVLEGANRIAFGPDGAMYTGLTNRGWATGTHGVYKIAWTGKMPLEIQKWEIQSDGFLLTFTEPVNEQAASNPDNYHLLNFHYEYHKTYGCDELDKAPVKVLSAKVSADRKSVHLALPELRSVWIYQLDVQNVTADDGAGIRNSTGWYTLNRLKQ